jgi:hypothetical protein
MISLIWGYGREKILGTDGLGLQSGPFPSIIQKKFVCISSLNTQRILWGIQTTYIKYLITQVSPPCRSFVHLNTTYYPLQIVLNHFQAVLDLKLPRLPYVYRTLKGISRVKLEVSGTFSIIKTWWWKHKWSPKRLTLATFSHECSLKII